VSDWPQRAFMGFALRHGGVGCEKIKPFSLRRPTEKSRRKHDLHNLIGLIELRPVFSFEHRQRCVRKVCTDTLGDRYAQIAIPAAPDKRPD
jgi:hypothetical protein